MMIPRDVNIQFERTGLISASKIIYILAIFGIVQRFTSPSHEQGGKIAVIISPTDHPPEAVTIDDVVFSDNMLVWWSEIIAPLSLT